MSDVSQFGQSRGAAGRHPDADQLSAFVEQALPAHEREEVLLHLAVCGDCRETVAMALAVDEPSQEGAYVAASARVAAFASVPVAATPMVRNALAAPSGPERKRRSARWTIWAPAVTAIAALGLILAYVHRTPKQPALEEQAQNAQLQSPVQSPAQPPAPLPKGPGNEGTDNESLEAVHAPQNQGADAKKPEPPAFAVNAPVPVLHAATPRDVARPAGKDEGAAAEGMAQAPAPPQAEPLAEQKTANSLMHAAPGVAAQAPAPAPMPAAVAPPPASQETVSVAAGAPSVETDSMQVSNASIAQREVNGLSLQTLRHPLPSKQPALSIASYGSRMLAVDMQHALFLSTDAGLHWKRVSGHWQGQAVRVNLVLPGNGSGVAYGSMGAMMQARNLDAIANNDRQRATAPSASLTGTVTDTTGAVIPRATVTVTDSAGQNAQNATTGNDGRYTVSGLTPGNHIIQAAAPGFELVRLEGVAVEASRPNVANLTLQVGSAAQSVTVNADSTDLETAETAKKKAAVAPMDAPAPPVAFEMTTDTGERWTSADGKTWKHE
jgi:hypothetical protein